METKNLQRLLAFRGSQKVALAVATVIIVDLALLPLLISTPALATVDQPDSPPTLSQIHINRNLANPGDMLFYFLYDLPYATPPTSISADHAFFFRLMSADGTTEYGSITPYPYHDNGYNDGISALYFPASANLTWETPYIIRISENPLQFTEPEDFNVVVPTSAYSAFDDQEDNQTELATNVYTMAQTLESVFDQTLFQTSGSQQVLTSDGETYFRGAISGLQAMAPTLFLIQQVPAEYTPRAWTTEQFDIYEHRFDTSWVGASENATAEQIGAPTADIAMGLLVILPLSILAIVFSSMKFRRAEPGYVVAAVLLIMGVLMGWMPKAIFASIYQGAAVYTAYLIFYARG